MALVKCEGQQVGLPAAGHVDGHGSGYRGNARRLSSARRRFSPPVAVPVARLAAETPGSDGELGGGIVGVDWWSGVGCPRWWRGCARWHARACAPAALVAVGDGVARCRRRAWVVIELGMKLVLAGIGRNGYGGGKFGGGELARAEARQRKEEGRRVTVLERFSGWIFRPREGGWCGNGVTGDALL
nr:cupredoxin domain containing protein [Paspalum simplex]